MAYMDFKEVQVRKYEVETQAAFKKRHIGLTTQAIKYAMDKGLIDFTKVSNYKIIVLSPKTANYTPNASKTRDARILAN